MKVEVKKLDATKCELLIEVSPETVSGKLDELYQRISKQAKIPGFRPGKAPRPILEKHHRETAHQSLIRELIPQIYEQAVNQQGLAVVDLPQISDIKLEGRQLSFKARVELKPEIKISEYKGLKINRKKIEVNKENIDEAISQLIKERSTPERSVSADDIFAKGLGFTSLDELRSSIERQLYLSLENNQRQDLENQIITQLLGNVEFQIPKVLIDRQLNRRIEEVRFRMQVDGKSKEEIDQKAKQLENELTQVATRDVKLFLILEEIATRENISSARENLILRVIEFLLSQAQWRES